VAAPGYFSRRAIFLHCVKNIDIYFLYTEFPIVPAFLDNIMISVGCLQVHSVAGSGTWFAVFEKENLYRNKGNI
jgi:hypothetical protein